MTLILDAYKENVEKTSLFSKIIIVDFYDGPTEAICKLVDSEQWLVGSIVYFDIEKKERIFTLLEITNESSSELQPILGSSSIIQADIYENIKKEISLIYNNYSGPVFLFRGHQLSDKKYEVVQIPLKHLIYLKDLEDVLAQTEESKLQWVSFFSSDK